MRARGPVLPLHVLAGPGDSWCGPVWPGVVCPLFLGTLTKQTIFSIAIVSCSVGLPTPQIFYEYIMFSNTRAFGELVLNDSTAAPAPLPPHPSHLDSTPFI